MGMRGYSLGAGVANWLALTQFNDRDWDQMEDLFGPMPEQALLVSEQIGHKISIDKPIVV